MGFQRTLCITTGIVCVLLGLTGCGGIGLQSDSQAVTVGTASTPSTATAAATSTSTKSSGILDRSGSQQQRDCLHCAP
jgi:hypothetical protein